MSVEMSSGDDNVLPLRVHQQSPGTQRAKRAAGEVRRQLSLLQGYADLMEGLSPQQHVTVLKVMAQKIEELTTVLRPFVADEASHDALRIEDYREAHRRNEELMTEFRLLLKRLRHRVQEARATVLPR